MYAALSVAQSGRCRADPPRPQSAEPSDPSRLVCRICHDANPQDDLVSPCLCKGSVKYVHGACLRKWLKTKYPLLGARKVNPKPQLLAAHGPLSDPSSSDSEDETNYCCEVCQYRYKLLVAPIGWTAFFRHQLVKAFKHCRQRPWAELRQTVSSHLYANAAQYIKYGFHFMYFVFLLAKLRRILEVRALLRRVISGLSFLSTPSRWADALPSISISSASVPSAVGAGLSALGSLVPRVPSSLPSLRDSGRRLVFAARLWCISVILTQYLCLLMVDIEQLYRALLVAKSRRSTVTIIY